MENTVLNASLSLSGSCVLRGTTSCFDRQANLGSPTFGSFLLQAISWHLKSYRAQVASPVTETISSVENASSGNTPQI